ncbi:MAG: dual specificity protein phosphatase family protein [Kiritimatiellales bacterium]
MFLFGPREQNVAQIPLEISGKLFVSPMPFGPYDKWNTLLKQYRKHHIDFVVVLVTNSELEKKARRDLLAIYSRNNIGVIRLPVADYTSPDMHQVAKTVDKVSGYLRAGARVAIHCNAGVGRSGVMACCIVRDILKIPAEETIGYVRQYMHTNMTDEQMRLVKRFQTVEEEVGQKNIKL